MDSAAVDSFVQTYCNDSAKDKVIFVTCWQMKHDSPQSMLALPAVTAKNNFIVMVFGIQHVLASYSNHQVVFVWLENQNFLTNPVHETAQHHKCFKDGRCSWL
jgi:hypothetical protein